MGKIIFDSYYRNWGLWKYGSLKIFVRDSIFYLLKNKFWNNEGILENFVKVGLSRNYFGSKFCEFLWEGMVCFMFMLLEKFDVYVLCCYI